ncbi:MAG: ABC transporter substrate-binding protein, partial [Candidatus Binatia bacterium]
AISRFGSASDYAVQAALEKLGVNPKQVVVIQLGGNPSRLGALTGGSAQASVFTEPYATVAVKRFGMKTLIDLAELGLAFPQNCFMVKRGYLEANRPKIVNFMKGVIEGLYALKRDKALALKLIKKYIRVEEEDAAIGYEYYLAKHGEGILVLPERRGLEFVIAEVAKNNPKAKGQTAETLKLLEPGILEEIKRSGFVEKVKQ